jgi:hypothetical protein
VWLVFLRQSIQMKRIITPLFFSALAWQTHAQSCVATASLTVTINNNCAKLAPKAFLQGPYDASKGMMNDNLRTASLIPTTSPQDATATADVSVVNNPNNSALNMSPDAIVDWVLVELRDNANPATIKGSAAALVQRDGDIVAVDGVSPVVINVPALTSGYYVAVKHRNHLGVMTGTAMPMLAGATAVIDFTTMANGTVAAAGSVGQSWGDTAQKDLTGGNFGMWAGDVTKNGELQYSGSGNDRLLILQKLSYNILGNVSQYTQEDVNLDGQVLYSGSGNDRIIILQNNSYNILTIKQQAVPTLN